MTGRERERDKERESKSRQQDFDSGDIFILLYSYIYIYLFFPTGLHFLKDALSGKTRILQQTDFDRKLPKTLKPPDTKRDFHLCVCIFFLFSRSCHSFATCFLHLFTRHHSYVMLILTLILDRTNGNAL